LGTEAPQEEVTSALAPVPEPEEKNGAYAALKRIAREWAREQDKARGFEIIGRGLASVMPCDRAYLLRAISELELEVAGVFGSCEQALQAGETLEEEARTLRALVSALDVKMCSDTRYPTDELERRLGAEGPGSALSVVLREQGQPLALLVVASQQPRAYGLPHMRLLREMASALTRHLRYWELRAEG
jgi:hypothetical protein